MIFVLCLLIAMWTVLLLYPYNAAQQDLILAMFHLREYAVMTAEELAHMHQVEYYFVAAFILTITLAVHAYYRPKPYWHVTLFCVLVSPLTLINFERTWLFLHEIFFPQGNYLFPYDSYLITTVPLEFFLRFCAATFILATILYGVWTCVYYRQWLSSFASSLSSRWSK